MIVSFDEAVLKAFQTRGNAPPTEWILDMDQKEITCEVLGLKSFAGDFRAGACLFYQIFPNLKVQSCLISHLYSQNS